MRATLKVKGVDVAALLREAASLEAAEIVVGVRSEKGATVYAQEEGETGPPPRLIDIAVWNHFGVHTGKRRVPARPFITQPYDTHKERYGMYLDKMARAVVDQLVKNARGTGAQPAQNEVNARLKRLGLMVVGNIQQDIADRKFTPNAPYTIKRKGSSTPLIDNGQLRRSIDFELRYKKKS